MIDLKLYFALLFAFIIEAVEAKAKTRWYYNRFPKPVVAGFTLAEILLTLTIIGLVASLTVPALMQNEQQAYFNAGVNNIYQELSQAVTTIQNNPNGTIPFGIASAYSIADLNALCNVMSCVNQDIINNIGATYRYYKGSAIGSFGTAAPGGMGSAHPYAILSNGAFIVLADYGNNCATTLNALNNICEYAYVDINGAAGPNMWGEDLYAFWIVKNNGFYSVIPFGTASPYGSTGDGLGCGIADGWYPASWGCTYWRIYNPNNMP